MSLLYSSIPIDPITLGPGDVEQGRRKMWSGIDAGDDVWQQQRVNAQAQFQRIRITLYRQIRAMRRFQLYDPSTPERNGTRQLSWPAGARNQLSPHRWRPLLFHAPTEFISIFAHHAMQRGRSLRDAGANGGFAVLAASGRRRRRFHQSEPDGNGKGIMCWP